MSFEHMSSRFENELTGIYAKFMDMGALVEEMINDALQALATGEELIIERVIEREEQINHMEVEIDNAIIQLFALYHPAASDLRSLIMISKMLADLERMGDEAEKITKVARRLHEERLHFEPQVDLKYIASCVSAMLRQVMEAFNSRDAVAAAEVLRSDKAVDKEWKGILRELISYMIEDPRTISVSLDMIFIARSIERIGDHCKNMAEGIIYMVQGADVRHKKVKKAEKVARGEI